MNYNDFQDYLRILKNSIDQEIYWPVVDIDAVEAMDHSSRYGLQIADLAIGGMRAAIEYDLYGGLEPRFAQMMRPIVYEREGNYLSYGAKLVPLADRIEGCTNPSAVPADLTHWRSIFG